jgi:hypothetical protein
MRRLIVISSFMFLLLTSCHDTIGPFDCVTDTPAWLRVKLDSIPSLPLTRVYRYEWRGEYVFHVQDPISSCLYCELYDRNGTKIQLLDDETFEDFLVNKKNQTLICEWKG